MAALIAQATGSETLGETADKSVVMDVYSNIGWLAIGAGVALILISPAINYLMHLKTLTDDPNEGGRHRPEPPIDQIP